MLNLKFLFIRIIAKREILLNYISSYWCYYLCSRGIKSFQQFLSIANLLKVQQIKSFEFVGCSNQKIQSMMMSFFGGWIDFWNIIMMSGFRLPTNIDKHLDSPLTRRNNQSWIELQGNLYWYNHRGGRTARPGQGVSSLPFLSELLLV